MRDAASPVLDRVRDWDVGSFAETETATSATWEACRAVDP
jgi:hypothetical protein